MNTEANGLTQTPFENLGKKLKPRGPYKVKPKTEKKKEVQSEYYNLDDMRPAVGVVCEVVGLGDDCVLLQELAKNGAFYWQFGDCAIVKAEGSFRKWKRAEAVRVLNTPTAKPEKEATERKKRPHRRVRGTFRLFLEQTAIGQTRYFSCFGDDKYGVSNNLKVAATKLSDKEYEISHVASGVKVYRRS